MGVSPIVRCEALELEYGLLAYKKLEFNNLASLNPRQRRVNSIRANSLHRPRQTRLQAPPLYGGVFKGRAYFSQPSPEPPAPSRSRGHTDSPEGQDPHKGGTAASLDTEAAVPSQFSKNRARRSSRRKPLPSPLPRAAAREREPRLSLKGGEKLADLRAWRREYVLAAAEGESARRSRLCQ